MECDNVHESALSVPHASGFCLRLLKSHDECGIHHDDSKPLRSVKQRTSGCQHRHYLCKVRGRHHCAPKHGNFGGSSVALKHKRSEVDEVFRNSMWIALLNYHMHELHPAKSHLISMHSSGEVSRLTSSSLTNRRGAQEARNFVSLASEWRTTS